MITIITLNLEHSDDVAGAEDVVGADESVEMGRGEEGGEHAIFGAFSSEIAAGGAATAVGHGGRLLPKKKEEWKF